MSENEEETNEIWEHDDDKNLITKDPIRIDPMFSKELQVLTEGYFAVSHPKVNNGEHYVCNSPKEVADRVKEISNKLVDMG